jgi:SAM-dependent methyltransferase
MNDDLAKQFDHQAMLTHPLRRYLYRKIALPRLPCVLDVGCGTGLIANEMAQRRVAVTGVDIDLDAIARAKASYPEVDFRVVNKGRLPLDDDVFDLAFCHFVLMWQADPVEFVRELKRVVRPGGWVVVAAEPDYGARIAHPDDGLTQPLIDALKTAGADPHTGRKLREIFVKAGMHGELGVWPSVIESPGSDADFAAEWEMYRSILNGSIAPEQLDKIEEPAAKANRSGARTVFLPVFYFSGVNS